MMARRTPRPAARKRGAPTPLAESGAKAAAGFKGQLEKALREPERQRYVLRLYVTGVTRASAQAVERVRTICEEHLHGRYELEVIDIYQLPALAKGEQIVATPTLIRVLPAPLRRFIGNLSSERIVFGLDLRERPP
jgi:circadian clock protein KaiB